MAYDHSAAYDLSQFETRPQVEKQPQKLTVVKTKPSARHHLSVMQKLKVAFCAIALVSVLSFILYNRVVLTELSDQIAKYSNQQTVLLSENVRLQSELEGQVSLKNLEEYVSRNFGMGKMEAYQVQYINLAQNDRIVVENTSSNGLADQIKAVFSSVMEYLK